MLIELPLLLGVLHADSARSDAEDVILRELRELQKQQFADHTVIQAEFRPVDEGSLSISRVGVDLSLLCWYSVTSHFGTGTDASRRSYLWNFMLRELNDQGPAVAHNEAVVDLWFPFLAVRDILSRSAVLESAERAPEEGYILTARFVGGSRSRTEPISLPPPNVADNEIRRVEYHLDSMGRVARIVHHTKSGPSEVVYSYSDSDVAQAVPDRIARVAHGRTLRRTALNLFDTSQDHLFDREEVVRMVALTNLEMQRLAEVTDVSPDPTQAGSASGVGAGAAPVTGRPALPGRASEPYNPAARYRTPLVLAGVFVFGLAAFAWWRQRA